jgi:O-antigen ligase
MPGNPAPGLRYPTHMGPQPTAGPFVPPRPGGVVRLLAWLIPLVVVGYPLAGTLAIFVTRFEPTTITYSYRALIIALSLVAIFSALVGKVRPTFPAALSLFLLGYMIRLYIDAYYMQIWRADDALLFYAGAVLPPTLAMMFAGHSVDEGRVIRPLFFLALIGSLALFLIGYLGIEADTITSLEYTGGRLNLETVNAITIGHVGASLLIVCAAAWFRPQPALPRLLILIAAAIGIATMLQAGSRGPFVALGFCVVVYAIVGKRWGILALAVAAVLFVALRFQTDQIVILERFTTAGYDASASARLLTQDYAISDFLDHPALGYHYIEQVTLDYPHNLFIDTAMSMGIAGLIPLVILTIQMGIALVRRFRAGQYLFALLATQYFIAAQFSGSTWGNVQFTVLAALILVAPREDEPASTPQAG